MKPFTCENCFECCYNVVVSPAEAVALRRIVRSWPAEEVEQLRNQPRDAGMCPFVDVVNKRCTVYEDRPYICRKFGYVERMQCSYNKHTPLQPFGETMLEFGEIYGIKEDPDDELRALGITITWESGLVRRTSP